MNRCSGNPTNPDAVAPNPSPLCWYPIDIYHAANGYIMKVKYIGCTNFEGVKIMVYRGKYDPSLVELDPHFADNDRSPIARFKPTEEGWQFAINLADSL